MAVIFFLCDNLRNHWRVTHACMRTHTKAQTKYTQTRTQTNKLTNKHKDKHKQNIQKHTQINTHKNKHNCFPDAIRRSGVTKCGSFSGQ